METSFKPLGAGRRPRIGGTQEPPHQDLARFGQIWPDKTDGEWK